ncbi:MULTISPECIES: hypothetical protein [unclassified Janthinobacterium]|uniref:hypothetical protein n=1 Tax=unclassified Janthinobacterium TaxID=2610881 RepID=UPI0018C9B3B0|nr:hypothetical protein [Janthinobacterium sp. CG_23.4]MDH6156196.1 hypothetical protein [Janthinobacterium sp. CG_23.4]
MLPAFFKARTPGQHNVRAESHEHQIFNFFAAFTKQFFFIIDVALSQWMNELLAIWEIAASAGGESSFETREKQKKKKKPGTINNKLLFG